MEASRCAWIYSVASHVPLRSVGVCLSVVCLCDSGGKLLGTSAGQTPGGDGFEPEGTMARRAAEAAEEAAHAQMRAQQARADEEASMQTLESQSLDGSSMH